ncbi:MAG: YajQ family cyclic di-GMP-binding protein [Coriobacteriia bacterium]|nr:YajQ family cyclic di-GMP-binding protein [Coriobacteriia bacterium]MBS5478301.1 YajQ family cyclic di-GMP-binding protein [Coriobacteriia bacterium]
MAKDSSFDVVSSVDMQEVDNAYQQTVKELSQRYDLKDAHASIELSKADKTVTVAAPSDFVAKQVIDIFHTRLVRRKVDLSAVNWSDPIAASGGTVRLVGSIVEGIDQELAKKISKDVRDAKFKVKVTVEGDKLRVTSPSKDALQETIAFLRDKDYGQPLQYVNYR